MTQSQPPDGPTTARVDVRATGVVQGVGFRYFVRREALRLGLGGWVANRADGSVELSAEGAIGVLEGFVERISKGPPGARVTELDVRWTAATGEFNGFGVRSGSHPGD
jgi:acylphosphatase